MSGRLLRPIPTTQLLLHELASLKSDAAGRLVACNSILHESDEFFRQVIAALHAWQQLHYGFDLFAHMWIGDSYGGYIRDRRMKHENVSIS